MTSQTNYFNVGPTKLLQVIRDKQIVLEYSVGNLKILEIEHVENDWENS